MSIGHSHINWVCQQQTSSSDYQGQSKLVLIIFLLVAWIYHFNHLYQQNSICTRIPGCDSTLYGVWFEIATSFVLLFLCLASPRTKHSEDYNNKKGKAPVILSATYLELLTVTWGLGFVVKAIRTGETLLIDMPRLAPRFTSHGIKQTMNEYKLNIESWFYMFLSLFKPLWKVTLTAISLRIIHAVIDVAPIYLFQCILKELEAITKGQSDKSQLIWFIQLLFAINLIKQNIWNYFNLASLWISSQTKTYQALKVVDVTLQRHEQSIEQTSDEETNSSLDRAYGILTTDTSAVSDLFDNIVEQIALPITLGLKFWLLYYTLGPVAILALVLPCLSWAWLKQLYKNYATFEEKKSEFYDKRLGRLQEILNSIQIIKLNVLNHVYTKEISQLLESEQALSIKIAMINIKYLITQAFYLNFTRFIILGIYLWYYNGPFPPSIAYPALTLMWDIGELISSISDIYPTFLDHKVHIKRTQKYLRESQALNGAEYYYYDSEPAKIVLGENELYFSTKANFTYKLKKDIKCGSTASSSNENLDQELISTDESRKLLVVNTAKGPMYYQSQLKDFEGRFPIGKLSLVIGDNGSGKTTLLKALLGEMFCIVEGNIVAQEKMDNQGLDFNIGYVPQISWLSNSTIRENILMGDHFDPDHYWAVMQACALLSDMKQLSKADHSIVGQRGVMLSGGQKQRVSLARALYSTAPVLLIDDCLSAVDVKTAQHLLKYALSSNASFNKGRTIILVTHHIAICAPIASYVIKMDKGSVIAHGMPDQLMQLGYINPSELELKSELELESENNSESINSYDKEEETKEDNINEESEEQLLQYLQSLPQPNIDEDTIDSSYQTEETEDGNVNYSNYCILYKYLGGWPVCLLTLTMIVILTFLTYFIRYLLSIWTDSDGGITHQKSLLYLFEYCLINIVLKLVLAVEKWFMYIVSMKSYKALHKDILHKVTHAVMSFFDTTPIGDVFIRFNTDMNVMSPTVVRALFFVLRYIIRLFFIVVVVVTVCPQIMVAVIYAAIMFSLVSIGYLPIYRQLDRILLSYSSPLPSLYSEVTGGAIIIRAFGQQSYYTNKIMSCIDKYNQILHFYFPVIGIRSNIDVLTSSITETLCIMIYIFSIPSLSLHNVFNPLHDFSVYNLSAHAAASAATAAFVLSYIQQTNSTIVGLINVYQSFQKKAISLERLKKYLSLKQEMDYETSCELPSQWPQNGAITFKNVYAMYTKDHFQEDINSNDQPLSVPDDANLEAGDPTATDPPKFVLKDLSLVIQPGTKVGVVGRTGSGKSTLVKVLVRLIELSSGSILIDDVDISTINLTDLRNHLTLISQDADFFSGTLRDNLDPAHKCEDDKLINYCEKLGLDVLFESEHISQDDNEEQLTYLDYKIETHGENLAAGQRQIAALVRAILRNTKIIIMDEATSHMDRGRDNAVQDILDEPSFKGKTIITIAHRLKTVINYDQVVVMDDGKVVETGHPLDLLTNSKSKFYDLCRSSKDFDGMINLANAKNSTPKWKFAL